MLIYFSQAAQGPAVLMVYKADGTGHTAWLLRMKKGRFGED
jgi:hypothetical protein